MSDEDGTGQGQGDASGSDEGAQPVPQVQALARRA